VIVREGQERKTTAKRMPPGNSLVFYASTLYKIHLNKFYSSSIGQEALAYVGKPQAVKYICVFQETIPTICLENAVACRQYLYLQAVPKKICQVVPGFSPVVSTDGSI